MLVLYVSTILSAQPTLFIDIAADESGRENNKEKGENDEKHRQMLAWRVPSLTIWHKQTLTKLL